MKKKSLTCILFLKLEAVQRVSRSTLLPLWLNRGPFDVVAAAAAADADRFKASRSPEKSPGPFSPKAARKALNSSI